MGEAMRSKLLFVITDGGRARLVEQSAQSGDFATVAEMDNQGRLAQLRRELRASPPARTQNSLGERRHAVGREEFLRPAKEAFVAEVADRAVEHLRRHQLEGVVVAAPRRLLGAVREALAGRTVVAESLGKDLTKTPDHDLGDWLGPIARRRFPPA